METLHISLPAPLSVFVEERVRADGYADVNEYFRALVLADQRRKAQEKLEVLLVEGLNSGPAEPLTKADLEEVKRTVRERLAAKGK
ncbi:MAG: type II toxin-antitoxin system ParD family antitoxin [Acidobacteria bacterium]|nr:type II toxin-antitoxin system ParD family antitoxin [Acidobacteriota bacterium]MBI3422374.1 type II toxin-antitoxin system ParD family antitoxin [Acidobacteriota bacterium]